MNTVILVGFSTAGKSHYCKKVKERLEENVYTFDTDKYVSSEYDNHIYKLYIEKVKPNDDRKAALDYINEKEIEAIESLKTYSGMNMLIAAGPFIVTRPNWKEYVASKSNLTAIYLMKTAEEVYESLIERRKGQIEKGLNKHRNFGSWDKDVLTSFNGGEYELVEKKIAISNIQKLMNTVVPEYEKIAKGNIFKSEELRRDTKESEKLIHLIVSVLKKNN